MRGSNILLRVTFLLKRGAPLLPANLGDDGLVLHGRRGGGGPPRRGPRGGEAGRGPAAARGGGRGSCAAEETLLQHGVSSARAGAANMDPGRGFKEPLKRATAAGGPPPSPSSSLRLPAHRAAREELGSSPSCDWDRDGEYSVVWLGRTPSLFHAGRAGVPDSLPGSPTLPRPD